MKIVGVLVKEEHKQQPDGKKVKRGGGGKMDGKACSVSGLPPAGDEEDGGKREGKKSSGATFLGVCV